jgi:hypothetical protein
MILGRAKVLVELATHYAGRSASSIRIRHDHRKFHDKSVVLLPFLGRCQQGIQFYRRTFLCRCYINVMFSIGSSRSLKI